MARRLCERPGAMVASLAVAMLLVVLRVEGAPVPICSGSGGGAAVEAEWHLFRGPGVNQDYQVCGRYVRGALGLSLPLL